MKRNLSLDLMRIIAILAVLSIHITGKSLSVSGYDILRLPLTLYAEVASRFGVPLFFIISGYTLAMVYKGNITLRSFFQKRIGRIFIPYVVWSLFYIIFDKLHGSKITVVNTFDKLLNGGAAIQFYFIPAIFLLYILFPIFQKYLHYINTKFFVMLTLFEFFLLWSDYFFIPISLPNPVRIALLNIYPFLIGMLTFNNETRLREYLKKRMKILCVTICIVLGVLIFETQGLYLSSKNVRFIDSQWQPVVFTYAILLWGFFLTYFHGKFGSYEKIIILLSKLSFFVFFVHIFYLSLFWRLAGSYLFSRTVGHVVDTLWFTPFAFIIVTAASYVTAYCISFIPRVNKALGIG